MTATNHAITGALIAVAIHQPVLAVILAFGAHFAMDAMPHFGIDEPNVLKRNADKRFLKVLAIDCAVALALLISVPILIAPTVNPWLVALCMFACMSPDLIWGFRFFNERRSKTVKPKNHLSRFHSFIQWKEFPQGIWAEAVWFVFVSALILKTV